MNRIASVKLFQKIAFYTASYAVALSFALPLFHRDAAALPYETERNAPLQIMPHTASPIGRIRAATGQVYRLIVEVEGAVNGGTAFLVSGTRVVATNHHVVEKGTAFNLGFVDENNRVRRMPLRLLAIYPQKDLALLEALDDLPGEALTLYTGHPDAATDLFAIGFPAAADPQGTISWTSGNDDTFFVPSVIKGYVSRVLPNRWFSSQLQHQTPIIPGYSGGPLVDYDGTVMGISTSIHKEANGISYAVLAGDLSEFVSACGLPTKGDGLPQSAPRVERHITAAAPSTAKTLKTFAIDNRSPNPNDSDRAMLSRANRMLVNGDITAARLVLEHLISQRNMPDAVASLAKSFDPVFLRQQKVLGVTGDAGKAAQLYKQAADLGDGEAKRLLTAINTGSCLGSVCKLVSSEKGANIQCERGKM
jgi:S1-C subfamily serine protease